MTRIFVYGTLKRGFSNYPLIARQTFVGNARTSAGYTLYSLGSYPGMVRAAEDTAGVAGELWEVDDRCLAALDELEGVDEGLYRRESVALAAPHDSSDAQTYLYARGIEGRRHLGAVWPR